MIEKLVELIRDIYGTGEIKLHHANITDEDRKAIADCERMDCYGKEVEMFEDQLKEYTGAKHVIATCSGTAALYTLSSMFEPAKTGFYIPNNTFVATKNAIRRSGSDVNIADIEEDTLGISNKLVGDSIPVHIFGHPCEIPQRSADGLCFEDAAQALGSFKDSKHVGLAGDASILSFNGNKIVTTGGGGAIMLDNNYIKSDYIRGFINNSFNLRMPALNAALGISQLNRIEDTIYAKRNVAAAYFGLFEGTDIRFLKEPFDCRSNYWLSTIILPDQDMRDSWFDELKRNNIEARKGFGLLDPTADTPIAKDMAGRILNLPSGVPR